MKWFVMGLAAVVGLAVYDASPNRPLVDWDRGSSDDVRQEARKYLQREPCLTGARK
jgi:hypothetical protein